VLAILGVVTDDFEGNLERWFASDPATNLAVLLPERFRQRADSGA
jgi:hypothetical protein